VTASVLKGSCLCGTVTYEVSGEPRRFYHCHCSRCRKVTGTGHASNLFLRPATLLWLSGEEQVRHFSAPALKRFANSFCAMCGSRLPLQAKGSDMVMIPAGSLDDEAPIKPEARIFSDSRVSWACADAELPVYAEFPPR